FVALALLPTLISQGFAGSEGVVTLCLAVFTISIALGSGLAARASRGRPNLALVPLGALLMGAFALLLAWLAALIVPGAPMRPADLLASPTGLVLLAGLSGLAVAGGLFIVPAFAALQSWAPVERRARVIAAVNVLNAAYMLAGGAVVGVVEAAGFGGAPLVGLLGLGCLLAMALVIRAWGDEVLRDFARLLFRFLFRLDVKGLEHIPPPGVRVIFAPNHVSLLDGPILHSILPQRAAFAVNTEIARAW